MSGFWHFARLVPAGPVLVLVALTIGYDALAIGPPGAPSLAYSLFPERSPTSLAAVRELPAVVCASEGFEQACTASYAARLIVG